MLAAAAGASVILDGAGQDALAGIRIDKDYITISGLTVQGMGYGLGTFSEDPDVLLHGTVIQDVISRNNEQNGLYLSAARDFVVDRVESYGNGQDGIAILGTERGYASHGWVVEALIHDNGPDPSAHGLSINQGHSIAVCDSVSYDNMSHNFDVSDWPKRGLISHNITLEGNTAYGSPRQAGFSINSDSTGVRFLRNIAHDNVVGFYCYEGCCDVLWAHNVAFGNKHGFQVEHKPARYVDTGSTSLRFYNNVSTDNQWEVDFAYPALEIERSGYDVTLSHNLLRAPSIASAVVRLDNARYDADELDSIGEGNFSAQPGFINPDAADFMPAEGSALLDAGALLTVDGIKEPFLVSAPDIGAAEVQ
ncbi:MAG: hypothetical protein ACI8S6_005302 [Myxococcota bacterium]